jgi:hypothetical protein
LNEEEERAKKHIILSGGHTASSQQPASQPASQPANQPTNKLPLRYIIIDEETKNHKFELTRTWWIIKSIIIHRGGCHMCTCVATMICMRSDVLCLLYG